MTALRAGRRRWTLAGVGLAALAGGLAACGEKDVVKDEPTPVPPTAAAPVQPQPSTTTPGAAAPVVDERGDERPDESVDDGPG